MLLGLGVRDDAYFTEFYGNANWIGVTQPSQRVSILLCDILYTILTDWKHFYLRIFSLTVIVFHKIKYKMFNLQHEYSNEK